MAGGNLAVEVRERADTDTLMHALNAMLVKLNETVIGVKHAASYVARGSQDLMAIVNVMSQGASQQSVAAEEVSSSMEQMVANIRQNLDNARQTEKMALESSLDAEQGGIAVNQTIEAMKAIAERITIIQDIASQTLTRAFTPATPDKPPLPPRPRPLRHTPRKAPLAPTALTRSSSIFERRRWQ
jgi:methyl-accepting chemotaxis protein